MPDSMQAALTIAGKEYRDALKSGLFITVLLFLFILSAVSIIVASLQFQAAVIEYRDSVKILADMGKAPGVPPQFYPLKLLRGLVDYLEMIGAIIGILLGYSSIVKEKNQRTLQLVLTRPIKACDIISGKILGNAMMLSTVLALVGVLVFFSLSYIGSANLNGIELEKVLIVLFFSLLYVMIFYSLTAFLSLSMKNQANSLILSLVIWLLIVMILPQIGDTMDPDNQIPGGFFKSMNIDKNSEKEVLARFTGYEAVRNTIEESSITKHYERLSFALLGIKDEYNEKPLDYIMGRTWLEGVWITGFLTAGLALCYYAINKRDTLLGGEIK